MESELSTVKRLLHKLRVPQHLYGYCYLCVVIPRFEVGTPLRDLYEKVAQAHHVKWRNVERGIARALGQSDAQGRRPQLVIAELKEQFESEREAMKLGTN